MKVVDKSVIRAEAEGPQIRCSYIDVMVAVPVTGAFVFEQTLDADALKEGLKHALAEYPNFAGSLSGSGTQWFIDCNTRGMRFEVVEHAQTLSETLQMDPNQTWKKLAPQVSLGLSKRNFLSQVRVNHFRQGGTVIGLSWNHSIGDWKTGVNFIRAWSDAVSGRPVEPSLLTTDRDAFTDKYVEDPSEDSGLKLASLGDLASLGVRMLFSKLGERLTALHFTDEEVAAIRADIQQHSNLRLSANDTLTAHLLTTLNELDPRTEARHVSIAVNYRRRKGVPDNAVGNFVNLLMTETQPDDTPVRFAERMRSSLDAWEPPYQSIQKFFESRDKDTLVYRFLPAEVDVTNGTALSNFNRFGLFDLTFGGGSMTYFIPVIVASFPWYGIVSEGYGGKGTQIGFNLPRSIVDRLRTPQVQERLHRFRPSQAEVPTQQLPWVL